MTDRPASDKTTQAAVIVPIPNATEQVVISPIPNAPVHSDNWIMLPTDPPQVMRRSDYDRMMEHLK